MAGSVLKPIHVSAKVVLEETQVPALEGVPFPFDKGGSAPRESFAVLEKGIHLHWALPDSLTQGKQLPEKGKVTIFPGVPDLWLVIRFNPLPPIVALNTKRSWRAWVVDSVLGTATQLEAWTPARRHSGEIHTLAGVLKRASALGYPGWGLWDSERTDFDPAVAAYYPSARKRFGFHDDLADLAGKTGTVSYTVIGWFADRGLDPLGLAEDRHGQLNHWKTLHHTRARTYSEMGTRVDAKGAADPLDFKVLGLGVLDDPPPTEAQGMALFRSFSRGGTLGYQVGQMENLGASFPFPPEEAGAPVQQYAAHVTGLKGPVDTLCHGTVSGVPLSGVKNESKKLADADVRLFPSIRRALAELAASKADQPDQVAAMEMLLDDLDRQRGTAGGLIDLPGAAHAMTFQGMPGKSQWFARLEIHPTSELLGLAHSLGLSSAVLGEDSVSAGFWPPMMMRAASEIDAWMLDPIPPISRYEPPPSKPQPPTPEEKAAWRVRIRKAFEATFAAAASAGRPIQPRLLNVVDRRQDAQPSTVGRVIGGGAGTDGASWWVDIGQYDQYDDASPELDELWAAIAGGLVRMPDQDNLYELPGPRWNRPWSPQVVLTGLSRSYQFGYDGRFELDGYTASRPSGEVLNAFSFGSYAPVRGTDLMDQPRALGAVPGLPPEAWSLAVESVLLDTENAPLMAYRAAAGREKDADLPLIRKHMTSAVRGLWLRRDRKVAEKNAKALAAVAAHGVFPSPIAYSPWKNPREPLFLDVSYSQPYSAMADWVLEEDAVELTAAGPAAVNPPPGQVEVMAERCKVTASLTKVLNSALLSKAVSDALGKQVQAQKPPEGVTPDTFVQMDALSAPLTQLDAQLIGRGHRRRAGALRLNRLSVYDKFGTVSHRWQSAIAPESPEGGPQLRYWTELPPRLPYWSRLNFRLLAAQPDQPGEEANPLRSPVLGILVPDFLEHALEVFDGEGRAIGQLTTERPQFGSTEEKTLRVKFELHPWVAAELNLPAGADAAAALAAIENPGLRALVAALLAQSLALPGSASTDQWFETGLSAMLRCIDTIRATLDPARRSEDRRARLLGEPILVLGARLSWQGAATDNPSALAGDPPLYQAPEELPDLAIRIGSATRPDDGVLGCFIEGVTPAEGRFAPVSLEAAEKAILNGLAMEIPYFTDAGLSVSHPFVKDQEARFVVPANQNIDVVILADIRGGLYATSGALPRKRIDLPREFIDPAVKNLEPSFRIGPILTTETLGAVKALAPPLDLEGMKTEYVYRKPATDEAPETFPEVPVPEPSPVAELPRQRVVLTEGWLRVYRAKQGG